MVEALLAAAIVECVKLAHLCRHRIHDALVHWVENMPPIDWSEPML